MKKAKFLSMLLACVAGSNALAADVDLSTDPEGQSGVNPVVYADFGYNVRFFILARRSGDAGYVQNLSLSVRTTSDDGGTGILSSFADNPNIYIGGDPSRSSSYQFRWDTTYQGPANTTGLSASEKPGLSVEGSWTGFGEVDFIPTHAGTTHIYLDVGPYGILESGGSTATTSQLGWGDAPVPNVPGAESTLWEATVIAPRPPVPEPAPVGLIATSALASAGLRRRR